MFASNIYFLPAGDENTASSRLRVFSLSSTLKKLEINVQIFRADYDYISNINPEIFTVNQVNVLVVQKRVTPKILSFVDYAQSNGAFIIYDIDDFGSALWSWTPPHLCFEMISQANLITTDTIERAEWLIQSQKHLNVQVLPNSIDYFPTKPVQLEPIERSPLRVLWFGTPSNLQIFAKYAEAFRSLPDIQIVICGGSGKLIHSLCPELNLEVIPWRLENFIQVLQSCDLSCLMHDGSVYDRQKSNHKMITSITWGVPAIVTDTPEYARVARDTGVDDAVFSNEQELLNAIQRYRSVTARKAYIQKVQPIVWEKYCPNRVAREFIGIVESGLQLSNTSIYSTSYIQSNAQLSKALSYISYLIWRLRIEENPKLFLRKKITDSAQDLLSKIWRILKIRLQKVTLKQ